MYFIIQNIFYFIIHVLRYICTNQTQILVILSKDLDSLVSTLRHNLQRVDGVKVHIQVTGNCQSVLDK